MHFRGIIKRREAEPMLRRLNEHIIAAGAEKSDISVVAIHVLYLERKEMDIEIFIPVDRTIPRSSEFDFMSVFRLEKCLLAKHRDHLALLPELITKIYYNAKKMNLDVKEPFYVVSKECPVSIAKLLVTNADIFVEAM
jgi:hypothetical protein